jgi:large subunit ribosomal protein L13
MSFPGRQLQRCWHLVDAKDQTVGRLASQIAALLKGKHKPTYRPNQDMGDTVVVINAGNVHFTGNKWKDKIYRWHTGYPGGLKERSAERMLQRNPTLILKKAVLGMLKKNNLRHSALEPRLKIFVGPTHTHTAQLPPASVRRYMGVEPLPRVPPKRNGNFHFGLGNFYYAHPASYQQRVPKKKTHQLPDTALGE